MSASWSISCFVYLLLLIPVLVAVCHTVLPHMVLVHCLD